MDVTLVTALYDLASEEKSDRRSLDEYYKLGQWLYEIKRPLVIFVESLAIEFYLMNKRAEYGNGLLTFISRKPFHKLSHYERKDELSELDKIYPIDTPNPKKDTILYKILCWNKLYHMRDAIGLDPFNSSRFVWVDFGCAHFATIPPQIDLILDNVPNKIRYCMTQNFLTTNKDETEWYKNNNWIITETLWGGSREYLLIYAKLFEEELDYVLNEIHRVPLEGRVMARIIYKYPKLFTLNYYWVIKDLFYRWAM